MDFTNFKLSKKHLEHFTFICMSDIDPYDVVVPGKLKLKRKPGLAIKSIDKNKQLKKRKKKRVILPVVDEEPEQEVIIPEDSRTEMERKVEAAKKAREAVIIRELASKSYRQRIEELNTHLNGLTEHFDVPKVGPG